MSERPSTIKIDAELFDLMLEVEGLLAAGKKLIESHPEHTGLDTVLRIAADKAAAVLNRFDPVDEPN